MEFKTDVLLHGGDYNPDQWLDRPDILERDAEMLAESGCNVVSLGIFAWSTLEPEEGVFRLDWMEQVIDRLYAKGIRVILATPSGARPKWLADKYPEVLRVDKARRRQLFGVRHNHCYTSPVYREKVPDHQPEAGRAFRQSSGGNHVAYFQRVRRRMSLPLMPGSFPRLAEREISDDRESQQPLVYDFLEPTYQML